MSLLKFHVRYADGRKEDLAIEAEQATIGSGAHCEIRLPVEAARVEHVSVSVTAAGVYAQAISFDPPPLVNGVPFTQGALLPESVLTLGNVDIVITIPDSSKPESTVMRGGTKQQKTSPVSMVLAAALLPLAAYALLGDDGPTGLSAPPQKVPDLWEAQIVACPQNGQTQALSIAQERHAVAETKRERSPFDIRDGVSAVPLYEAASACFKAAGDNRSSEDDKAMATSIRDRMAEEYKTHVVWLEHCLKIEDWRAAQREVALLMAYTEGKKGEYVTWLSNLERHLRVKYGQRTL